MRSAIPSELTQLARPERGTRLPNPVFDNGRIIDDDGTVRDLGVVTDVRPGRTDSRGTGGPTTAILSWVDCASTTRTVTPGCGSSIESLLPSPGGPRWCRPAPSGWLQAPLVGRDIRGSGAAFGDPHSHELDEIDAGTVLAALADPMRRDVLAAVAARVGHGDRDRPRRRAPRHPPGDRQASRRARRTPASSPRCDRDAKPATAWWPGRCAPASDWIQRTEASWSRRVDRLQDHLADRSER